MADEFTATQKLAWHNRRVLAERHAWPAGVLEACERTERDNPTWRFGWSNARQVYTATHATRQISYRYAQAAMISALVDRMIDLDVRAAGQRAEWELLQPRGWSVLRSQ